jgi:cation transport regulator ChaB
MNSNPQQPDAEPNSDPASNVLDTLPETLPDDARNLYYQAYNAFIAQRGNNPELAHQAGMAAVLEHYELQSNRWRRKR